MSLYLAAPAVSMPPASETGPASSLAGQQAMMSPPITAGVFIDLVFTWPKPGDVTRIRYKNTISGVEKAIVLSSGSKDTSATVSVQGVPHIWRADTVKGEMGGAAVPPNEVLIDPSQGVDEENLLLIIGVVVAIIAIIILIWWVFFRG